MPIRIHLAFFPYSLILLSTHTQYRSPLLSITAKLILFCNMAQIQLSTRSGKYSDDKNSCFLNAISKQKREQAVINMKQIKVKMQTILKKMQQLDRNEIEEWSNTQQNKINQLSRSILVQKERGNYDQNNPKLKVKIKALKQHLRLLVFICNRNDIDYNQQRVTDIIKNTYFSQYGNDIFPYFKQVGYSTQEFEVISYKETSLLSYCCCWEETAV